MEVQRAWDTAAVSQETMHRRPIPSTGEALPVVGLGTWATFDVGASRDAREPLEQVLRVFATAGGTLVDSSPMYGRSEAVVGEITQALGLSDQLFFATKVWTKGREAGISQMEESQRRLKSRVDLMQVHNLVDVETHLETLRDWKREGRIRYLGVTHYNASAHSQVEEILRRATLDFLQINYSIAEPEAGLRLLPLAGEKGLAVIANRPFAGSALLDRVRGKPLPAWAGEVDCASWGELLLKWILGHPAVTCVIPATGKPQHLEDNMRAGFGRFPDEKERERIAAAVLS